MAAGQTSEHFTSGGIDRTYLLYVPTSYDGTKAVPLVFNFHGHGSSASQQIAYGDFRPLADRDTFVLVAPDGQGSPRHFNLIGAPAGEGDDVVFVTELLDDLAKRLCIDTTRVYSTGMSNGGALTSILACRASDRFAAFGPVAAVVWAPACSEARPVAIAAFMGTADPIVPFDGGTVNCCGNPTIGGAPDTMASWAEHDQCTASPDVTTPSSEVEIRRWTGCSTGSEITFFVIKGGGHTWPGAQFKAAQLGPTTTQIDASATLWDFFKAHRLAG
jgi:polyhydroxybutyrate depolymerase